MTTADATYNYPQAQANKHVEIDLPTGLPKLSIELLPDIEPEEYDSSHRKHSLRIPAHPADMAGKVSTVYTCTYNFVFCLAVYTSCAMLQHPTASLGDVCICMSCVVGAGKFGNVYYLIAYSVIQ